MYEEYKYLLKENNTVTMPDTALTDQSGEWCNIMNLVSQWNDLSSSK